MNIGAYSQDSTIGKGQAYSLSGRTYTKISSEGPGPGIPSIFIHPPIAQYEVLLTGLQEPTILITQAADPQLSP